MFFRVRLGHEHDICEAGQALQNSPGYRPRDHAIFGSPVQFGPARSIKLKPGEERGKANDNIGAGHPQIPAEAMAPAGSSGPARRPRTSSPDNKRALRLVGLGVVIDMLRSRRFYERVAVGAIVLAAVRNMGQEQRASTLFERLSAWNKRQIEILERKAEQQALRLERQAKREARRLERKAKRQARRMTTRTKRGSADRELALKRTARPGGKCDVRATVHHALSSSNMNLPDGNRKWC